MSNLNNETTPVETPKPSTSADTGELKDEELENISGGRRTLNPQPLPPFAGF